jgi:c-di-GMP-binding flagellar brake protein YcgR
LDAPGSWLKPGERVQIETAQKDDATYFSEATVVEIKRSKNHICVLQDIAKFRRVQHRRFARLPVNLEAKYAILPQQRLYDGLIMNISSGGAIFATQNPLQVGCSLQLTFEIELDPGKKVSLDVEGEVVREFANFSENNFKWKYSYGIKFEISVSLQDKIVSFIFRPNDQKG